MGIICPRERSTSAGLAYGKICGKNARKRRSLCPTNPFDLSKTDCDPSFPEFTSPDLVLIVFLLFNVGSICSIHLSCPTYLQPPRPHHLDIIRFFPVSASLLLRMIDFETWNFMKLHLPSLRFFRPAV